MPGTDLEVMTGRTPGRSTPESPPLWRTILVAALWSAAVVSVVGVLVLLLIADENGILSGQVIPTDIAGSLVAVAFATFGAIVILRGDGSTYGWLMLALGTSSAVIAFFGNYSLYALEASVPFSSGAVWIQDQFLVTWPLGILLMPALFPDGRFASPRWRRAVLVAGAGWLIYITYFALAERQVENFMLSLENPPMNPIGVLPGSEAAIGTPWIVLSLASIVIGLGSLVTRWRRADSELRQRFKWVLYALAVLLAVTAVSLANEATEASLNSDFGFSWSLNLLLALAQVAVAVAIGFAVLRFRLYDVDLVINRTIVYGILTMIVVAGYVAVVAGVGSLVTVEESFLALLAAGAAALAFSPLRSWVQRAVNRSMFGLRDQPYAVLSEMGRLMTRSGAPESALQTLAETVAMSLKLPGAVIELEDSGAWNVVASYGIGANVDQNGVAVPLRHQDVLVGRLIVAPRSPRESLTPRDRDLLEDIAHPAGALARSVQQAMALQRARERLVLAREEERRRIRRDLHDGLGPSLASQTFQLDAVLERLEDDPAGARTLVLAIKEQNQELVSHIRRLVYELRPPALDELGVAGALEAHVAQIERSTPLSIEIETVPKPMPPLPAAVEVAAYRIAREAITNTVRHALAATCTTTLEATNSTLVITIRDDGVGIGRDAGPGVGLMSMRERTEELGGVLTIGSVEPHGTTVVASLPLMDGGSGE